MLKLRLLTILVFFPLYILAVLYLTTPQFSWLSLVFVALAALEWAHLIPLKGKYANVLYLLMVLILAYLSIYLPISSILIAAVAFWILATILVIWYSKNTQILNHAGWAKAIFGVLVLIPYWQGMVNIHGQQNGHVLLLYVFILVWAMDCGGYIFGRWLGRHRLLPAVSPGKTLEGLLGGLLLVAIASYFGSIYFSPILSTAQNLWFWYGLALITGIVSVIGDLTESMMKRQCGVKDSGQILPGHGGILDRFDSMTAAVPIFAFGLLLNTVNVI